MTGEVYFGMKKINEITVNHNSGDAHLINRHCLCDYHRSNNYGAFSLIHSLPRVNTCYAPAAPEEGRSATLGFLVKAEVNLRLRPDTANWSPFNFDKYNLFIFGPAAIHNYQEATLAIFMDAYISLFLQYCCSFV